MNRFAILALLGTSLPLAACQGGIGGVRPMGGGGGGAGNGGGVGGSPNLTLACDAPALGTPVLRLLTPGELVNTLNDIFPQVAGQWSANLPAGTVSAFGFDNDAGTTVGKQLAGGFLDTAQSLATAVTGSALGGILPCATTSPDRACAEQLLSQYGPRLFRRPLTTAERNRFLAFFDASLAKSNFGSALKWMLIGLIQSPNAVYRSEIGTVQGGGTRKLSSYELATALSYTYGGSTPSAALLAMADSGDIGDKVAIARALQATPQGKDAFQRFFQGYLGYTSVSSIQKPNIANFSAISADMIAETEAFIADVIVRKGGGVRELLTAPTTYPSAALAAYYQFPAPASDFAAVVRPAGRGLGILAQGSFLATHASSNSSSPTKRGLFPYFRLFCQPKLEPPPNVPQISPPMPGAKTTRQRYEDDHVQGSCAACHTRFDPIGFGFEHFDEGGRFRETEGPLPINSADAVPDPQVAGASLFSFTGQEDLVTGLAAQPIVSQCVAAYMATYAFGTGEACIGAGQVAALRAGTVGLSEAFVQLAAEPHFTGRTAQ
jgi:Protein of unknown function (DUF1588)/Protein of unknown function (DUF1592)/Protein of unknown function (DUF1595)/Protein of unknown function (DUF1587)